MIRKAAAPFAKGCDYALRGIAAFYRTPKLWSYAALPLFVVLVFYTLIFYWLFFTLLPDITSFADNATGFWGWCLSFAGKIIYLISGLAYLVFAALFASTFFEMTGAIFFSFMVRAFEKKFYSSKEHCYPDFRQDCINTLSSILYSLFTALLLFVLTVVGFFIPIIPLALSIIFGGYRYAIGYCTEPTFNKGRSVWNAADYFADKKMLYGFGIIIFLLLMIPFVSIFLIPGFVIGGAIMINEET